MACLLAISKSGRGRNGRKTVCCAARIPKEVSDAHSGLGDFGDRTVSIGPAAAQTYDPAYPVCLHVYGRGANYYECRYTSLPQCKRVASGRAAQCVINPYLRARGCPRDDIIAASTSSFWSARSGCGKMECLREGIRNECLSRTINCGSDDDFVGRLSPSKPGSGSSP